MHYKFMTTKQKHIIDMMGKNTTTTMLMTRCHLISLLLLIGLVLSSPVVSGSVTVATDQEEVRVTAVEAAMKLSNGDSWKYCIAPCDDQCTKRCTGTPGWVVYRCNPKGYCCCEPGPVPGPSPQIAPVSA